MFRVSSNLFCIIKQIGEISTWGRTKYCPYIGINSKPNGIKNGLRFSENLEHDPYAAS